MPANAYYTDSMLPVLSVSELNLWAKDVLVTHMRPLNVRGEVSNLIESAAGHCYFTLKDANAQIRCAMFKHQRQHMDRRIKQGDQVIAHGEVSLYQSRGDFQLIVQSLSFDGSGLLQQQFEQLKASLAHDGLFDTRHKQALPQKPQHIAVITSSHGAAIHDIISVLKKRFAAITLTVIPAQVQGIAAAPSMINAIQTAVSWQKNNQDQAIDAIIIGRGGGSMEDLWAFNDEILVRALFDCPIPVVSAVGHETDVTLCDFVADVRAPTPSAAAELISPDVNEIQQRLDTYEARLHDCIQHRLMNCRQTLSRIQSTMQHPYQAIQGKQKTLAYAYQRLCQIQRHYMHCEHQRLAHLTSKYQQYGMSQRLTRYSHHLDQLSTSLQQAMKSALNQQHQTVQTAVNLLDALSPLAIVSRGYAMVKNEHGRIISDVSSVHQGDRIAVDMHQTKLMCQVISKEVMR